MSDATKRRRSFSMAYLLAQCAPPLKLPDKQPTAYSYNGVVLPKLPEVLGYKDALLKYTDESRQKVSVCFVKGVVGFTLDLEPDNANRDWAGVNLTESGWVRYDLTGGEWVHYSNYDTQRVTTGTSSDVLLFWSSSDIYSQDTGKLYLAASDPIQVSE